MLNLQWPTTSKDRSQRRRARTPTNRPSEPGRNRSRTTHRDKMAMHNKDSKGSKDRREAKGSTEDTAATMSTTAPASGLTTAVDPLTLMCTIGIMKSNSLQNREAQGKETVKGHHRNIKESTMANRIHDRPSTSQEVEVQEEQTTTCDGRRTTITL